MRDAQKPPKWLARNPYVKALSMRVYPVSPREVIVVGGSSPHTVTVSNGRYYCDCIAGSHRATCSHVLAIHHLEQTHTKDTPLTFTTNRGSAQTERKIYVPVPRKTLYGGLLAGWWTYQKADKKGVMQDRIGMRLLVTHISGKNWERLDDVTEAVAFFSNSFYHNEKAGKESYLFTAMRALTGASTGTLEKMTDEDILRTIDEAVGTGLAFMAEPLEDKATKVYSGNIAAGDTFEVADEKFSKLAQAMAGKLVIETTDGEDQRRFIKSPKPKELPEGMTAAEYLGGGSAEEELEEIPF